MGDLSGADEARRAGAALAQRHGYEELRVRADLVEASVALERRDLAVAEPPLERARARAQELELGALVVEADVLAGWLALERGDRKAQLAIGERLARSAGDRPVSPLAEIEALLLLAESHCRAGHHQAAFDLLQRACPRAGEVGLWEAVVRAWHLLGVTAAALGRADVARDALGRAAQCIAAGHDGWTPVEAERFRSRRRLAAALSAHGPGA
jgi:ATP/maltotriose-dependent transcriptional regulator MalT